MAMMKTLYSVLDDKGFGLVWADERDRSRHWTGVGDVAVSLRQWAVSVPRRRRDGYHVAEVLHEVAHLELWRWTGRRPLNQNELVVCQLAIDIAQTYGFGEPVLEWLYAELTRELTQRSKLP